MSELAARIRDSLDRYGRFQLVASDLPELSEMFAALEAVPRMREALQELLNASRTYRGAIFLNRSKAEHDIVLGTLFEADDKAQAALLLT